MKKNKILETKFFKFLKYFFSLIVVPLICFIIVGIFGSIALTKDAILKEWFANKRNIWNDIVTFYTLDNKYGLYGILFIVIITFFILISLNYKDWFKSINGSFNNNNCPFLFNQETQEGNLKKFKKEFSNNDEPGFCIGKIKKYGYMVNHTDAHMILLGIAGSGKTWRILFQNIVRNASLSSANKPNMVIIDPKQELLEATGGILKQQGYEVRLFDLENPTNSVRWNPLKTTWDVFHLKPKDELDYLDYSEGFASLREVVEALKWGSKQDDGIWIPQAKNIISTILKFMILYSLENKKFTLEEFTLANVVPFLNIDVFTDGQWINIVKANRYKSIYWEKLHTEMQALISTVPETLTGILINATSALFQFSNDFKVNEITSNNNIDFDKLLAANKPFAIFISFPDHKKSSSFLIPILISQIYAKAITRANISKGKKLDRTLLFILEELNSIEKIPDLGSWMSISRSRRIFFLLTLQDYTQLEKYNSGKSEHKLIKSQARLTVFLETNNEETLKEFSEMLGKYEAERTQTSSDGKRKQTSTSKQKELVMEIADLKYKNKNLAIVLSGGFKPIAIKPMFLFDYMEKPSYEHIERPMEKNKLVVWDFNTMQPLKLNKPKTNNKELEQLLLKIQNLHIVCKTKQPNINQPTNN